MKKKHFLFILIFIFIAFFLSQNYLNKQETGRESVKAAVVTTTIKTTPTPTITLTPTPTPMTSIVLKKASYTIAIFGDSMVDTMGEKLEDLQKILAGKYPQTKFNLYNYGIGGQNVEQGLARFESTFNNKERQYPPLPTISADVIIISSFAYNPFSPHDKNKHYTLLSQLVAKAKNITSSLYLLAEIAPLKIGFGKGKNGVNWTDDERYQHAVKIIEQLDNVVSVSSLQNVRLINAYYQSRTDGQFGDPDFVNPEDGIHPSTFGHAFMANLIAQSLEFE